MLDLSTLNPQQLAAVKKTEGPLLVLAGAGSGKTRVITCRIGHLLLDHKVRGDNILAVTFTNKAAGEMKERVDDLVGREAAKGMVISTFHSLCVRLLRRDIDKIGYKKNFSIYTTSDQLGVMRQIMREAGIDGKKFHPESILWKISGAKNRLVGPERYNISYDDPYEKLTAELYPRYQAALKAYNAVDFDDIIMLAVRLLKTQPEVLDHWQERFRYIMVDEYQDTNTSQYLLVNMLAAKYRNLCVVGDDDQSIYGWRGADVSNILDFEKDYAEATVIKLEQNYRSTGNILEAANSVIKNNAKRKEKRLWTASGEGRPIDVVAARDDEDEASFVVQRIQTEAFRHNLDYNDFAILYRTNAQSRAFEEQLRFESIPYVLIGAMEFFERKEVKDSVSYLKALANLQDEQALLRILNFPKRGITDATATKINAWSMEHEVPLFEAFLRVGEVPGVPDAARVKVLNFYKFMREWSEIMSDIGDLTGRVRNFFRVVGIEDELYRTVDDPAVAKRKVENVEQVINSVAAYDDRILGATLTGFLEKISLMDEDRFSGKDKKEHGRNAVTLMSLHASKGLEFPYVFLVGMEEEILPHKRSIYEDFTIDEERRLCYVGITRARKHLTITRCDYRKKYGRLEGRVPSRFLDELPPGLVNNTTTDIPSPVSEEEADKMAGDFFSRMRAMLGE